MDSHPIHVHGYDFKEVGTDGVEVPRSARRPEIGPVEMGGMFTILKVRAGITSYEDPGWYKHPAGTVPWKVK